MASRTHVEGSRIDNTTLGKQVKFDSSVTALSATGTIDKAAPFAQFIDPNGGARGVKLPANTDAKDLAFLVYNTSDATSGEGITFKTATGANLSPSVDIGIGEGVLLINPKGTGWKGMMVGANT